MPNSVTSEKATTGVLHSLRLIASFALLGAVLMGVAVGWMDRPSFDPRIIGAVIGAVAGIIAKATHAV
jgi:hypothetical protein